MFNYTELPNSIKGVDLGKKYDKRHLKQNSLHRSLSHLEKRKRIRQEYTSSISKTLF